MPGNVVSLACSRRVEVIDRHRTEPIEQDLPNDRQTSEVGSERLSFDVGELTFGIAIGERERCRELRVAESDPEDVVEQPVRLDQRDVVQRGADAVLAVEWPDVDDVLLERRRAHAVCLDVRPPSRTATGRPPEHPPSAPT